MNDQDIRQIITRVKETNDKKLTLKLLVKIRTDVIKDDEGIKKFKKFGGIPILVPFLATTYEKIIDVVLSTLGNCCIHSECGIEAFDAGIVPHLLNLITYIPSPSILGRACRLLANMAKHSVKIIEAIQDGGAATAISSILDENENVVVLQMAIRLAKVLWNDIKFQNEIITQCCVQKIVQLLLKHITNENATATVASDDEIIDTAQVNIKSINGRCRTITRQKFEAIRSDTHSSNIFEKIMPYKKSYDDRFSMPEKRELLDLISGILRCLQEITSVMARRIADQINSTEKGYCGLVYLANEDSSFRSVSLKILSNLVSNIYARGPLGSADIIFLCTNLLTAADTLQKPLDPAEIRYCIRIVCLLTGDACNRAKIRTSGAFAELLKRARTTSCDKEFATILYAFYQYQYDEVSTNLLIDQGLITILVRKLMEKLPEMTVDHIKTEDNLSCNNESKRKQTYKRTRDLSPFGGYVSMTKKQAQLDYDPGSPASSSGYGSGGGKNPRRSLSTSSQSPRKDELETDFDSDTYSPVCSDVDDDDDGVEHEIESTKQLKDDGDVNEGSQKINDTSDIFSIILQNYDESLLFPPSDSDENDEENENKERNQELLSDLHNKLDFEKKPVIPILVLLLNATTVRRDKDTPDFVKPETLSTLLKLAQLIPKPQEKIQPILVNILRRIKNFMDILSQDFVFELYELKRSPKIHDDCKSCTDLKEMAVQLMSLLGTVGESGYGRGEMENLLITGEKMKCKRSAIMTTFLIRCPRILYRLLIGYRALDIVFETILVEGENLSAEASLGLTQLAINLKIGINNDQVVEGVCTSPKTTDMVIYDDTVEMSRENWGDKLVTFVLDNDNSETNQSSQHVEFSVRILMETCDVFNSMLTHDFQESVRNEITLVEVSVAGLKYFLYLLVMQSNGIDFHNTIHRPRCMTSALDAYELSIKYMLPEMERALFRTIERIVDADNVLWLFEWSMERVNERTRDIAVEYFLNSNIEGERKVALFRCAAQSEYSDQWKRLICEQILSKCSS